MIEHTAAGPARDAQHGDAEKMTTTTDEQEIEKAVHMPRPSIWPIVSAFGVTMISFGFLAGAAYGVFGAIVLIVSLWGWIGEMRHE